METEVNNLVESIKFMFLGMGVVYLFLIILIWVVNIQAKIIGKYFPDKEAPATAPAAPSTTTNSDDESARVAAIIAAVTEFRKNR